MILTKPELIELTRKVKWSSQARELELMGIPYRKRSDGSLVVFSEDLHHASAQKRPASPRLHVPQIR